MKLPKLKYYYYAMTSDAYIDFAVNRTLEVNPAVSIDLLTGQITGRTLLILGDSTTVVDDHFRAQHKWKKPVYVLRVPADLVDRKHLKRLDDHLYQYTASITIQHCGVERFELQTDQVG